MACPTVTSPTDANPKEGILKVGGRRRRGRGGGDEMSGDRNNTFWYRVNAYIEARRFEPERIVPRLFLSHDQAL